MKLMIFFIISYYSKLLRLSIAHKTNKKNKISAPNNTIGGILRLGVRRKSNDARLECEADRVERMEEC